MTTMIRFRNLNLTPTTAEGEPSGDIMRCKCHLKIFILNFELACTTMQATALASAFVKVKDAGLFPKKD